MGRTEKTLAVVLFVIIITIIYSWVTTDTRTPMELGNRWCEYRKTNPMTQDLIDELYIPGTVRPMKGTGQCMFPSIKVSRIKKVTENGHEVVVIYVVCNIEDIAKFAHEFNVPSHVRSFEQALPFKKVSGEWKIFFKSVHNKIDIY